MRRLAPALAALVLVAGSGCIRRTLEITSDPPGAQLIVNGQPAGLTPTVLSFRAHGVYRIELRRSGYRPVTAAAGAPARFWELAGPDLVAEVLWPGEIRDARRLHYQLQPEPQPDKEKLLAAARRAAEEAERLIPKLTAAPPPNPNAADQRLRPSTDKLKPPKARPRPQPRKPPEVEKPEEPPPVQPAKDPSKVRKIPEPEAVPEIEAGQPRG